MKLGDLFSGEAVVDAQHAGVAVTGLAVDSRAVKRGDVFFALSGAKTDGSRFIEQALSSGAVAIVSDRVPQNDNRAVFIASPNPRRPSSSVMSTRIVSYCMTGPNASLYGRVNGTASRLTSTRSMLVTRPSTPRAPRRGGGGNRDTPGTGARRQTAPSPSH